MCISYPCQHKQCSFSIASILRSWSVPRECSRISTVLPLQVDRCKPTWKYWRIDLSLNASNTLYHPESCLYAGLVAINNNNFEEFSCVSYICNNHSTTHNEVIGHDIINALRETMNSNSISLMSMEIWISQFMSLVKSVFHLRSGIRCINNQFVYLLSVFHL